MSTIHDMLTKLRASLDLPDPAAPDPMPILRAWFDEAAASKRYDDPNAMVLATTSPPPSPRPSARVVLCKGIEQSPPTLVFFTNYESRKACDLEAHPFAAAVFHWPHAQRQARVEGTVERTSDAESDEYFASRSLLSRIGAWASRQSRPLSSRTTLMTEAARVAALTTVGAEGGATRRPSWWGGYRLHIASVELWSAREGRLHDRFRWTRTNMRASVPPSPAIWSVERLSP